MLIVIGAFSLICIVAGFILYYINPPTKRSYSTTDYNWNNTWGLTSGIIGTFLASITLIATLAIGSKLICLRDSEQLIAMHEEENARIEEQIATAIESYQEHELNVMTEVAPESAITLVTLYPTINSDEMVQKQLEIYYNNHNEITTLKSELIRGNAYRWWLYFGGGAE